MKLKRKLRSKRAFISPVSPILFFLLNIYCTECLQRNVYECLSLQRINKWKIISSVAQHNLKVLFNIKINNCSELTTMQGKKALFTIKYFSSQIICLLKFKINKNRLSSWIRCFQSRTKEISIKIIMLINKITKMKNTKITWFYSQNKTCLKHKISNLKESKLFKIRKRLKMINIKI